MKTKTPKLVGKRVEELRLIAGLTRGHFASLIGISLPHLALAEVGKRNLSDEVRERIADYFHIPLASLYDSEGLFSVELAIQAERGLSEEAREELLEKYYEVKQWPKEELKNRRGRPKKEKK